MNSVQQPQSPGTENQVASQVVVNATVTNGTRLSLGNKSYTNGNLKNNGKIHHGFIAVLKVIGVYKSFKKYSRVPEKRTLLRKECTLKM